MKDVLGDILALSKAMNQATERFDCDVEGRSPKERHARFILLMQEITTLTDDEGDRQIAAAVVRAHGALTEGRGKTETMKNLQAAISEWL